MRRSNKGKENYKSGGNLDHKMTLLWSADMYDAVAQAADDENRSINNWVITTLLAELNRLEYL